MIFLNDTGDYAQPHSLHSSSRCYYICYGVRRHLSLVYSTGNGYEDQPREDAKHDRTIVLKVFIMVQGPRRFVENHGEGEKITL